MERLTELRQRLSQSLFSGDNVKTLSVMAFALSFLNDLLTPISLNPKISLYLAACVFVLASSIGVAFCNKLWIARISCLLIFISAFTVPAAAFKLYNEDYASVGILPSNLSWLNDFQYQVGLIRVGFEEIESSIVDIEKNTKDTANALQSIRQNLTEALDQNARLKPAKTVGDALRNAVILEERGELTASNDILRGLLERAVELYDIADLYVANSTKLLGSAKSRYDIEELAGLVSSEPLSIYLLLSVDPENPRIADFMNRTNSKIHYPLAVKYFSLGHQNYNELTYSNKALLRRLLSVIKAEAQSGYSFRYYANKRNVEIPYFLNLSDEELDLMLPESPVDIWYQFNRREVMDDLGAKIWFEMVLHVILWDRVDYSRPFEVCAGIEGGSVECRAIRYELKNREQNSVTFDVGTGTEIEFKNMFCLSEFRYTDVNHRSVVIDAELVNSALSKEDNKKRLNEAGIAASEYLSDCVSKRYNSFADKLKRSKEEKEGEVLKISRYEYLVGALNLDYTFRQFLWERLRSPEVDAILGVVFVELSNARIDLIKSVATKNRFGAVKVIRDFESVVRQQCNRINWYFDLPDDRECKPSKKEIPPIREVDLENEKKMIFQKYDKELDQYCGTIPCYVANNRGGFIDE